MFWRRWSSVAWIACLFAAPGGAAVARDWPQWGGSNARNMASEEKGLPDSFEPGKKKTDGSGIDLATTRNVKWVAKLGSGNYSSPVVAHGKVFIGTNDTNLDDPRYQPTGGGLLLCLDAATGKRLWQLEVPKLVEGKRSTDFDEMNLGICSTPAVEGNRVYVVTNRCDVLCLDVSGMANGNDRPFTDERRYSVEPGQRPVDPKPGDADIVWQFDMLNRLPVYPHDAVCCSPLVYGDCVYVCTGNATDDKDHKPALPHSPSLIALDKHDGHLLARDEEMISARVYHGQWSSPSLGEVGGRALVFFGAGDGVCYAFDALAPAASSSGTLRLGWSFDCNTPEHKLRDGKLIEYAESDQREHCGNHNDWKYLGPNEIIGTPVFYSNRVYVAVGQDPLHGPQTKGGLFCIDATRHGDISRDGAIWSYPDAGRSLSTVAIADGLLYLADNAGRVHCLDADTGKLYWVYDAHADIWSSALVADGKVYVGTRKSLCVLAAGKEKKLLTEIHLGAAVRSTPTVSDGVLYVASQRYLWAVQLNQPPQLASQTAESGVEAAARPIPAAATAAQPGAVDAKQSQDGGESQEQAVAQLEKFGGKVGRDESSPGRPIVSVEFDSDQFTDAGIRHFRALGQLRELTFDGTQITDAGLEQLQGLPHLQSLSLCRTRVSAEGLEHLGHWPELQELDASRTTVGNAGLAYLKELTRLELLDLGHTAVDDKGAANLKGLTHLRTLRLSWDDITDDGLVHLRKLTNLRLLDLRHTGVSDAGLASLEGLSQLEDLHLGHTSITDDGLLHLRKLPHLKILHVQGDGISDDAAKGLRSVLPNVEVRQ